MESHCLSYKKEYSSSIQEKEKLKNKLCKINKVQSQSNEKNKEKNKCEWISKVTEEDLRKLCDQLSVFNNRIQTIKGVFQIRNDLNNKLQEKLEEEAEELGSLYRELQDTLKNFKLIHNQIAAVVKEKLCIKTQVDKIKADEVNELEVIVSVYDNVMMERWQSVKNGDSVLEVENFLQEVKGKLQAMKNLQILGTQKFADLKKGEKKEQNVFKKEKNCNKSSSNHVRADLSECDIANILQSSLPDTDSEELMDNISVQSVLYNLVSDNIHSLPSWTDSFTDID